MYFLKVPPYFQCDEYKKETVLATQYITYICLNCGQSLFISSGNTEESYPTLYNFMNRYE